MKIKGMDGHFESNSILVNLSVSSPLFKSIKKTLPVIIDTGCTSDLILTYAEAFPLALTLVGLQEFTIADGSRVNFFECLGKVTLGSRTVLCSISIRPSGSPLMGVSLLKKIGCKLEIDFTKEEAKIVFLPFDKVN